MPPPPFPRPPVPGSLIGGGCIAIRSYSTRKRRKVKQCYDYEFIYAVKYF